MRGWVAGYKIDASVPQHPPNAPLLREKVAAAYGRWKVSLETKQRTSRTPDAPLVGETPQQDFVFWTLTAKHVERTASIGIPALRVSPEDFRLHARAANTEWLHRPKGQASPKHKPIRKLRSAVNAWVRSLGGSGFSWTGAPVALPDDATATHRVTLSVAYVAGKDTHVRFRATVERRVENGWEVEPTDGQDDDPRTWLLMGAERASEPDDAFPVITAQAASLLVATARNPTPVPLPFRYPSRKRAPLFVTIHEYKSRSAAAAMAAVISLVVAGAAGAYIDQRATIRTILRSYIISASSTCLDGKPANIVDWQLLDTRVTPPYVIVRNGQTLPTPVEKTTFIDNDVTPGRAYTYRVGVRRLGGLDTYGYTRAATTVTTRCQPIHGADASIRHVVRVTPTDAPPNATFHFAAASPPSLGRPVSYRWAFGDAETPGEHWTVPTSSAEIDHQFNQRGLYVSPLRGPVRVEITYEDGSVREFAGFAQTGLTRPPVCAGLTAHPGEGAVHTPFSFTADARSPDGSLLAAGWDFGDGTTGLGSLLTATHYYGAAGTYPVTVDVIDAANGQKTSCATTVVVAEAVRGDTTVACRWSASPLSGLAPLAVAFEANAELPEGGSAEIVWSFGDGASGGGLTPTHTYTSPGSYPVTVTVTDDRGGTGTCRGTIVVRGAGRPDLKKP